MFQPIRGGRWPHNGTDNPDFYRWHNAARLLSVEIYNGESSYRTDLPTSFTKYSHQHQPHSSSSANQVLSFSVLSFGPPCVDILGLISFDILGLGILTFMLSGEYFAEIFHTMLLSR